MADNWARKIFGTSARPRYGSGWSIAVLAAIALLFVLLSSWVLAVIFGLLAAGAVFVRNVRRST